MRTALSAQLKDAFRIVAVAEDASAAIALAEEHQPDAALLDVDMPNGGAREAVPQIAARSPGTSIVILSGDETREIVLELISAGAIAYVRKGVTGSELSPDAVRRAQGQARSPARLTPPLRDDP